MGKIILQQEDADRIGIDINVVRNGAYEEIERVAELVASNIKAGAYQQTQDYLDHLCSTSLLATVPDYPYSFKCEQSDGTLVLNAGRDTDFIGHIKQLENAYGISVQFDF